MLHANSRLSGELEDLVQIIGGRRTKMLAAHFDYVARIPSAAARASYNRVASDLEGSAKTRWLGGSKGSRTP